MNRKLTIAAVSGLIALGALAAPAHALNPQPLPPKESTRLVRPLDYKRPAVLDRAPVRLGAGLTRTR